tara:strand:+ start:74 stop:526 length:453 start_codon:yes stop_codon:yes gene_type:complete
MALKDGLSGRRMDAFVQTSDGTATRVVTTTDDSSSGLVYSSGTTATVNTSAGALVQKTEINGKTGSWFVYNPGAVDLNVEMYAAYASGAVNWSASGDGAKQWDKVGSTQVVSAGGTKHIPFNNKYRFVALVGSTSTSSVSNVVSYIYATN